MVQSDVGSCLLIRVADVCGGIVPCGVHVVEAPEGDFVNWIVVGSGGDEQSFELAQDEIHVVGINSRWWHIVDCASGSIQVVLVWLVQEGQHIFDEEASIEEWLDDAVVPDDVVLPCEEVRKITNNIRLLRRTYKQAVS